MSGVWDIPANISFANYESPIQRIFDEMQTQMIQQEENQMMMHVRQAVGFDVDKEELLKALQYDREQYKKGYADGLKADRWIPVSEMLPKEDGEYLLFGKITDDEEREYTFIGLFDACAEKFGIWEDYYDPHTLGFEDSELEEYASVLAWMPLPEPYGEDGETDDQR